MTFRDLTKTSSTPPARIKAVTSVATPSIGPVELEKDKQMDEILRKTIYRAYHPSRTMIMGERRNEVAGERFTTRDYLTPQGLIIEVKTIMEMEYVLYGPEFFNVK